MEFVDSTLQRGILRLLYDKWFKDYIVGISVEVLVSNLKRERNEIILSLEILQSNLLSEKTDVPGFYRITVWGIDIFEKSLAPSILNRKIQERNMILEILLDPYKENINQSIYSDELMKHLKDDDLLYLDGLVEYLEQKGFVKLHKLNGGKFHIKLTAEGFQSLQDVTVDNARVMSNAYEILFHLENRLRRFIESKLRSEHGPDWWDSRVSQNIRKAVDNLKQSESHLSWKVSASENITDYLLFKHLEQIIITNWEVFKSIFHSQQRIIHRLGELEGMRHSIAHTRMLSQDGMNRLDQYSQDLLNMIKSESLGDKTSDSTYNQ